MPTVENLRYPAATDTPDVPRDVGNLATDVAARTPYAFAAGSVNITTAGGPPSSGTAAVVFPVGRFSGAGGASPVIVVAVLRSGAGGTTTAVVRITGAATSAGCTIGLSNVATAGTYTVDWYAVQDNP